MQKDSLLMDASNTRIICKNCMDFDADKNVCTIRYVIDKDVRNPMPRKPSQKGCQVFLLK